MGIIENVAGTAIGISLINGKIRPKKKEIGTYLVLSFFFLFSIGFLVAFIIGLINLNFELIFMGGIGCVSFGYLLLISPYTQGKDNYTIKVLNPNSFEGFELFYKIKK